tara:strand:- start:2799 stop:3494 length:696 start_codon:yes stop_codon:yes gene_type:complete
MTLAQLKHLAIIMDGNGRWANARGQARQDGHEMGVDPVKQVIKYCLEHSQINTLTLFAYSLENLERPKYETIYIEQLLLRALCANISQLCEKGVRLKIIGDLAGVATNVKKQILDYVDLTKANTRLQLNICFRYSGRWHIMNAMNSITKRPVTEDDIKNYINNDLGDDPDLLIRTGGELRISNFLLWNIAYTELYFLDRYWPDFSVDDLKGAIEHFNQRQRRYGKVENYVE